MQCLFTLTVLSTRPIATDSYKNKKKLTVHILPGNKHHSQGDKETINIVESSAAEQTDISLGAF